MTLSSLSTFQCIKVDEDLYKMRIHMDFECYSSDHIAWAMITGVPMLIVWVLAVPIVGFVVLFKFRNRLEDKNVKKYLLLLYQGLKPKCFYWEFVNTIRKFLTVAINVFLSSYDTYYRILAAISVLIPLLSVQRKLMPYKNDDLNKIEMLAINAGVITLYCGMIFAEENPLIGYYYAVVLFLFTANLIFITRWVLLFLISLNFKHSGIQNFIKVYAVIIWQRKLIDSYHLAASIEQLNQKDKPAQDQSQVDPKHKVRLVRNKRSKNKRLKSEKRQDVLKREKAKNDVADHHLMKLFEENVHKDSAKMSSDARLVSNIELYNNHKSELASNDYRTMPKVLQSQKDRIMELHSNQIKKALQSHDWSLSHNRTNDYAQYEPSNEGKRRRRVGRKRKKTLEAIKTNDEEINLKADGRDWGPPKREVYPMSPDYVFKEEPYRFFSNKIEKNDPILSVLERDEEDES